MTIESRASPFISFLPLLLTLGIWQVAGSTSASTAFFFSTPTAVLTTAFSMLRDDIGILSEFFRIGQIHIPNGGLIWNASVTGVEALSGFIIGNVCGATFGVTLWYSTPIAQIARPYLAALGALPVFAIAPMTILWFGIGIEAKIALAALSTVFLAAAQAFKGAEQVDPLLLRRLKLFGASKQVIFMRLLLPTAMVWIVASLRLTIGAALLGAFIGEFIASEQGIGRIIIRASSLYDTPRVLVGVFAMIGMAVALDFGVLRLEDRIFKWRKSA
jgi:NitT/TauT family transport system permease protein